MLAADVMRSQFATIKATASLIEAVRLLLRTNQRGLPVLDEQDHLVGMVSEGDLLHRDELGVSPPSGSWVEALLGMEEVTPARERMRSLRISTIMTPNPVVVDKDATVDEVVAEMDRRQIAQLPVVCAGKVIGMISRVELIAALEHSLGQGSMMR